GAWFGSLMTVPPWLARSHTRRGLVSSRCAVSDASGLDREAARGAGRIDRTSCRGAGDGARQGRGRACGDAGSARRSDRPAEGLDTSMASYRGGLVGQSHDSSSWLGCTVLIGARLERDVEGDCFAGHHWRRVQLRTAPMVTGTTSLTSTVNRK